MPDFTQTGRDNTDLLTLTFDLLIVSALYFLRTPLAPPSVNYNNGAFHARAL